MRVAFPAVPGCVGELDADDIDSVVNLVDHVPDLLGDLAEAVGPRGDDADLLS